MRYKISPSRIGDYFVHNCDRFMVYDGLSNSDRRRIGWDEDKDFNQVAKQAGEAWEVTVLEKLAAAGEYVAMVPSDDMSLTKEEREKLAKKRREETIRFLREARPGYIYQAVLYINDIFTEKFMPKVDVDEIIWNDSMSDLLRVEYDSERDCPKFSVIDMKHAKRAKINHKVQICVYIRMLEAILEELEIPGYVDDTTGYVWPFKAEEAKSFSTSDIFTFVEAYFDISLPNVISSMKSIEDNAEGFEIGEHLDEALSFCLSQKCEWCGNLEHCMKWAESHAPVLLMPYMTPRTQEFFMKNPEVPRDLEGFREYIKKDGACEKLSEESGFLKTRLKYMENVLRAIEDMKSGRRNTFYKKPVYNMEMPKGQDVKIVLTVQRDVGLDMVYLYGVDISVWKDKNHIGLSLNKNGFPQEKKIFLASDPSQISNNTKSFVEYIYDIFLRITQYNSAVTYDEQLSVQGFVMDNYESYNLEEGLFAELLRDDIDMDYRDKLLAIIFWMQGERMITDSAHQGNNISDEFPLVVLSSVIGRLFVIPGYISNNLEDISKAMSEDFNIDNSHKYSSPLSNTLKSEPINDIWHGRKDDDPDKRQELKDKRISKLTNYLEMRLAVVSNLISNLQREDSRHTGIKRYPSKFSMITVNEDMDERISKLYIQQMYEQLLSFHDMKRVRMGDLEEEAKDGKIAKIRVISETPLAQPLVYFVDRKPMETGGVEVQYEIINDDVFFLSEWYSAITVEINDTAADELASLNDRNVFHLPDTSTDPEYPQRFFHTAYLSDVEFHRHGGRTFITGKRMATRAYAPGTELYIVERFTDIVGDKTIDKLGEGLSHSRILYPEGHHEDGDGGYEDNYGPFIAGNRNLLLSDYIDIISKYIAIDGMDFSPSQKKAFRQFFEKNITLLLGPPGSGKTDFIARAVIALCGFFKERYNYNLSVLVSANSHAAINNILEKLNEKLSYNSSLPDEERIDSRFLPSLIKLDKYDSGIDSSPVPGVEVYKRWYGFSFDPERGKKLPDKNPTYPVFPLFMLAQRSNNIEGYNYQYPVDRPFVVGATGNSCGYTRKKLEGDRYVDYGFSGFDVVIIDEASQVRTGDAMSSMDWSNASTRFLIVGDENQLSPIILGKYEAPETSPDIYGSIFRMYYDIARRNSLDYLCQLEENFRMNEILDRYPGEKIYDVDIVPGDGREGYHSFRNESIGDAIANQKLTLDIDFAVDTKIDTSVEGLNQEECMDLMKRIVDPEYPLVLIKLSGGNAKTKQELELSLATEITRLLKKHLLGSGGSYYRTDGEFWGDADNKGAFAIISPHHEHINKLKDRISDELGMDRDTLFIGTVDKLQGQEREATLVSYGVSNIEKALSEISFIYSRNRLNVSITRGKKKTIVILTDALLDKPIELLDVADEEIEKGISFMCDFEKFMKRKDADTEVTYDELAATYEGEDTVVRLELMRKRCV